MANGILRNILLLVAVLQFTPLLLLRQQHGRNGNTLVTAFVSVSTIRPNNNAKLRNNYNMNSATFTSSTRLGSSEKDDNNNNQDTSLLPFNARLVGRNVLNQALIGSTIWNGGLGFQVLTGDSNWDTNLFHSPILLGCLGVLPLLYLSYKIETDESPLVATLNLSTNVIVLRMFGATPKPISTFVVSAFLAGLTGLAEEVTFRGEVLPFTAQWYLDNVSGSVESLAIPAGFVLSTLVFAALHVNPLNFFRGNKEVAVDTLVLFALQLVTGSTFGILFLATGNLAVPIVAHTVYDFYTFYKTHNEVTGQMEYAKQEGISYINNNTNSVPSQAERKWSQERGEDFVKNARETFFLMDVNKDRVVSRKELRVALYSYGINLSKVESEQTLSVADTDDSGDIDFDEFLEFVGPEGDTDKAVQRSLLGV